MSISNVNLSIQSNARLSDYKDRVLATATALFIVYAVLLNPFRSITVSSSLEVSSSKKTKLLYKGRSLRLVRFYIGLVLQVRTFIT